MSSVGRDLAKGTPEEREGQIRLDLRALVSVWDFVKSNHERGFKQGYGSMRFSFKKFSLVIVW